MGHAGFPHPFPSPLESVTFTPESLGIFPAGEEGGAYKAGPGACWRTSRETCGRLEFAGRRPSVRTRGHHGSPTCPEVYVWWVRSCLSGVRATTRKLSINLYPPCPPQNPFSFEFFIPNNKEFKRPHCDMKDCLF